MYRMIFFSASALLLNACAVTDDPGQGGLLSGVYGLSSGTYEQRVQEREHNLQLLKQAQQSEQTESQQLSTDKAALASQMQQLHVAADGLQQELTRLDTQLAKRQAVTQKAQQHKQSLLKKAKLLRSQADGLRHAALKQDQNADQVAKLRAEEQRLNTEIKALQKDLYIELE